MEFDVELSGPDGALTRTSGRQNRLQAHELHACADPGCLGKVHNLLASVWGSSPDVTETDRAMFETAVIEIAANIVRHGSDEGRTCAT